MSKSTNLPSKDKFHRLYDKLAENYDFAYGRILAHGRTRAITMLELRPGLRVLEVGIGTGLTLPNYPEDAFVIGIDISEEMLAKARERSDELKMKNVELHAMNAEKLDFPDGSFDRVFAPSVLSAVTNPKAVFAEMVRVTKKGGLICILSHFEGSRPFERFLDRAIDPLAQKFLGFRTTTPRDFVEKNPLTRVVDKQPVFALNFSTIYLLRKR